MLILILALFVAALLMAVVGACVGVTVAAVKGLVNTSEPADDTQSDMQATIANANAQIEEAKAFLAGTAPQRPSVSSDPWVARSLKRASRNH